MQILAELDGAAVARATIENIPTIERLLADDPTSPQHVATTTLIGDEVLGNAPLEGDLAEAFARIDADPNQLLLVILDDSERVIGTLQLTFVSTMARGGSIKALVSGARIRAGADSITLGKRVFAWVVKYAKSRGARVLVITIDKDRAHIQGFFTTMGFRAGHDAMTLSLLDK